MYNTTVAAAMLIFSLVGLAVLALVWRAEKTRDQRSGGIHAHADGTVHAHFLGSTDHEHPTFADRYDAWLTTKVGPSPRTRIRTVVAHHGED